MRVCRAASSDVANQETPHKVFWDWRFRDSKEQVIDAPVLGCSVADTHAHLDMLHYPQLALARAAAHGVDFLVTVTDPTEDPLYTYKNLADWQREAQALLAEWQLHVRPSHVRSIVGCHPHNASKFTHEAEQLLIQAASNPLTGALGEIGLDYHYDHSPRPVQREVFKRQLVLAHEMQLPVSLHLREAHQDGLRILAEEGMSAAGTLLHCFNLDFDVLKPFLELGCQVAFGGPLTFKKCDDLRVAAQQTLPERIHTETDAPFMAPHPVRGTVCGPEHTVFIAAKLVEVFGAQDLEATTLLMQFYNNARDFFDRAPSSWQTSSWQNKKKATRILVDNASDVVA